MFTILTVCSSCSALLLASFFSGSTTVIGCKTAKPKIYGMFLGFLQVIVSLVKGYSNASTGPKAVSLQSLSQSKSLPKVKKTQKLKISWAIILYLVLAKYSIKSPTTSRCLQIN